MSCKNMPYLIAVKQRKVLQEEDENKCRFYSTYQTYWTEGLYTPDKTEKRLPECVFHLATVHRMGILVVSAHSQGHSREVWEQFCLPS